MNEYSLLSCRAALLLGLAGIVPAAFAADRSPAASVEKSGEIPSALHGVRIDHAMGPVTVVGVDSNFGWSWKLEAFGDKSAAEAFVGKSSLAVTETDGTMSFVLATPDHENSHTSSGSSHSFLGIFNWSVSYSVSTNNASRQSTLELRVPRAIAVGLHNEFGRIDVTAIDGPLKVDGTNAPINLRDDAGQVTATTAFGTLHAERIGPASLRNQNGAIEVSRVNGALDASTSFGTVRADDISGRADLKSQNGSINATQIGGELKAVNSFGRIEVRGVDGNADITDRNGTVDVGDAHADLAVETSFGEIKVADVTGSVRLKSQNGRIQVDGVNGSVTASNSFGAVEVKNVRGDAMLDSQNGSITAVDVAGGVHARTSFGGLRLEGSSRSFDAKNQNGAIRIVARSSDLQRIDASTSFGAIDISLPGELKPLIRADTSFGNIKSKYPVVMAATLNDNAFDADTTHPKINLKGQNGDIRIGQVE